jgi:hypothetical protein
MHNSVDQPGKADPSVETLPRATDNRNKKFRASFLALLKVLSSLGLLLVFYGAIRHLVSGLKLPKTPDWKNPVILDGGVDGQGGEKGEGSLYLLGVGKADITGYFWILNSSGTVADEVLGQ